jgi:hypothetical protein
MSSTRLKVCTFNSKCPKLSNNYCSNLICDVDHTNKIPDSLIALAIAIQILPNKADIYNIQNIKNKNTVDLLLEEISRVKTIMDNIDPYDSCEVAQIPNDETYPKDRISYFTDIACMLNDDPYFCKNAVDVKNSLVCCGICGLNYVESKILMAVMDSTNYCGVLNSKVLENNIINYKGVDDYNAYISGSCVTLIKKSLCITSLKTHKILGIDSLVTQFCLSGKKFVNVNINLDCINTCEDFIEKKIKIDNITSFIKKYEACRAVIMTGAFGDIDYDTPQFLFNGVEANSKYNYNILPTEIKQTIVPSDFPCDTCDPIYENMDVFLEDCKQKFCGDLGVLQYIRLKNCKKNNMSCCISESFECKSESEKRDCCSIYTHESCEFDKHYDNKDQHKADKHHDNKDQHKADKHHDNKDQHKADKHHDNKHQYKDDNYYDNKVQYKADKYYDNKVQYKADKYCGNRAQRRLIKQKSDKIESCKSKMKIDDKPYYYDNPVYISTEKCNSHSNCEIIRISDCKTNNNKKTGYKPKQTPKINKKIQLISQSLKCDNDKPKYVNTIDICDDWCEKGKKSCCESCKHNGKCNNLCNDPCTEFEYCDIITVLKRELCLYNALNKISDVNDRYTGFYNYYNKSRVITNNSELIALDHFLISNCLKNNVAYACLSDICMERCNVDVNILINSAHTKINDYCNHAYQYDGTIIKSFFTNRVYCVDFQFPHILKGCNIDSDETLHGLGLTNLWSLLCTPGCDEVSIDIFEKFGLDNHPYFRDFFWDRVKRNSDSLIDGSFVDNSAIRIQKKSNISEIEFYTHLMHILSNIDSRDRFITTIAYMDSIYRLEKIEHIVDKTKINLNVIYNQETINDLFTIISMDFKNKLSLGKYKDSVKSLTDTKNYYASVWEEINMDDVNNLIDVLSVVLIDNCLYMEILIRYAVCVIEMLTDTGSGMFTQIKLHNILGTYPALGPVVSEIKCGGDVKQLLTKYIDTLSGGPQQIGLLFTIINEFNLSQ